MKKGLGYLFITSSSSHLLNKTDFEQYLLKNKNKYAVTNYDIFCQLSEKKIKTLKLILLRFRVNKKYYQQSNEDDANSLNSF